jgi:serine/threonine protein kinase
MPPKDDRQDLTLSSIPKAPAPTEISPAAEVSIPTVPALSSLDSTTLPRPEGFIGRTLDERYFIEKELGQGGIGVVYLARDRRLMDKRVVVKALLEQWLQDAWVVGKFLQEREALARVDHPGIVGILDAGELPDGKPYIVMQCVEGVTLRSVLQPEGMEIERAGHLIEQMADALNAAHEKGILHRDLKPENIMLHLLGGGREQVKIIDFGIAKVRDSAVAPSTVVSATVGTVAYMSPEQLRAAPLTPASDIYALGVISYEMLTGRRPFNPESKFQMLDEQRAGVRVRPRDLRPALSERAQSIILKALAFEPKDRYQNAAEFGRALMEALEANEQVKTILDEEKTVERNPPEQSSVSNRAASKFKKSATLALALLLVAVIALAVWRVARPAANSEQNQPPQNSSSLPMTKSSLTYSLLVQKIRDDGNYEEELSEFAGKEIFRSGDRFRFNASSPQAGYLYLFNNSASGVQSSASPSFTILYPTPKKNEGSAQVRANEPVQTSWNTFGGAAGTERFWVVWASEPVEILEGAKQTAFGNNGVVANAPQAQNLREFLAKYAVQQTETTKDEIKGVTTVTSAGTVLVDLIELQHR